MTLAEIKAAAEAGKASGVGVVPVGHALWLVERCEELAEAAKRAKSIAAAPDYDEEAIRNALWALVDLALARLEGE